MDNVISQVIVMILGGFLAAGTGWFLDWRREQERTSKIKKLLTTGICDDLRHSIVLYEKIIEDWPRTKTIWFSTLNEIRESRYIYHNNKDWVILYSDENLRKAIFRYYLQSAESINNLDFQQKRKHEIEKKVDEIARNVMANNRSLDKDQLLSIAKSHITDEQEELTNLVLFVQDIVNNKLKEHKSTAERLLEKLENQKL